MSLKARLRLAVALLMSAVVLVLSGLYMRGFLIAAFTRTQDTAASLVEQFQSGLRQTLETEAREAKPPPVTPGQAKQFWRETVQTDPLITDSLERVSGHWTVISEIFITDDSGKILASSTPYRTGMYATFLPDLGEWKERSLITNLRQVYWYRQDTELRRSVAIVGESKPVLITHVVVSSLFLRNELKSGLEGVGEVFVACLVVSLILALVLPSFVVSPLERLSQSLDRMATGGFSAGARTQSETKEFAAVYSKLSTLEQQFLGARENADRLRGDVEQLLERLEQAVLLFDAAGRLTMAGSPARRLLDRDPAELVGCTVNEIFPASSEIGALVGEAVQSGEAMRERAVSVSAGGREYSVLVGVQPLARGRTGLKMGTLVTLHDADTRVEVAAKLDMADRLTALSRLTHGVAHEIKNPLNAITLHLEILRSRIDGDTPELNVIAREISRLDRVLKTFLNFNRPVTLHLAPVDLNDLAGDIAQLVRPEAEAKKIVVEVRTRQEPAMLNADRDLLKQAVLNVVMNAVEAMKSGGNLALEVRRGGGRVEIVVSDTGPGIPPEMQSKIFDLYFSTKPQGSGVGLPMTFRFVQLHDGKIEVSSEVGRGTTFRFSFPEAVFPTQTDIERSHSQGA